MDSDSLWNLAKASGSTMAAIRKANQLTQDPQPGQMLLIPVI
jgi:LysM repeat protein